MPYMKRKTPYNGPMRRSYVKKSKYTKQATKVVSKAEVRKQLLGLAETKRFVANNLAVAMSAGTFKSANLCFWIPTSSNDSGKIGDEIYVTGFEFVLSVDTIRNSGVGTTWVDNDITFNWWLLKYDDDISDGIVGPTGTLTFPDFRLAGAVSNCIPDKNRCTVIASGTSRVIKAPIHSVAGNVDDQNLSIHEYVPINQKFVYKSTSSGYGKFNNFFLVYGYNQSGSAGNGITNNLSYVTYFKDM